MNTLLRVTTALVATFALAGTASAQIKRGDNEIGGRGSFSAGKYENEDSTLANLEGNLYIGHSLTDRIQIGPAVNFNKLQGEKFTGAAAAFVDYHFGNTQGKMIPYLEIAGGQFIGGDKGTYFSVGPGLKWYLADGGGALILFPYYRHIQYDQNKVGYKTRDEVAFSIGVAINLP